MSQRAARIVGECFEGINICQLNSVLSDTESRKAMTRLRKLADKTGVSISITDPFGTRLFRQIRVHWASSKGEQINVYYPNRIRAARKDV